MLKLRIVCTIILLISASCSFPVQAQNPAQIKQNNSLVQVQPAREQILNACVQNQAETLPNPFTDVPRNHWAYKAVLTMYYCGVYREATPPDLLTNRPFIKVNAKKVNHTKKVTNQISDANNTNSCDRGRFELWLHHNLDIAP